MGIIAHARILIPKNLGGADNNTCVRDPGKNGIDVCSQAKREHKALTIDQKLEILDQISTRSLDPGSDFNKVTVLCKEYGIGRSTISDIKKQEPALHAYK